MISSPFSKKLFLGAFYRAIKKLNPFYLLANPVMLITEIGAIITTVEWIYLVEKNHAFYAQVSIWLWLTVLFANFAEAVAEMRSNAQTAALRKGRVETFANLKKKTAAFKRWAGGI